ncbi:DUF58 domain-containing protein [Nakamurella lactea]|uniref:DUF58 domain-containing protein n=1 Tax=Nakamurella lactea TaxID=459515 RepID=UPI00040BFD24|nr:DUF58 domain-containing protein [Nakamurella lactea]
MTGPWRRTAAFYRALALVVFAVGMGLAAGRADVVILGAPLALGLLLALLARPVRPAAMAAPRSAASVGGTLVSRSTVGVTTDLDDLADAEFATVLLPDTTARPTGSTRTVAGSQTQLKSTLDSRSWGPTMLARPDLMAAGPDGLTVAGPGAAQEVWELVLPAVHATPPLQLPPINGGWAGAHLSRRPGQGNDLVDLRDYAPGDRMRSVHWRAYARLGKLYTRRTLSDADVDLMLCLDVRSNLGPRLPVEPASLIDRMLASIVDTVRLIRDSRSERAGGPGTRERLDAEQRARYTTLDHAVHAATAIGSAQLGAGDRVGVMTVSSDRRQIRPGSGTRHLQRIRYFLANLTASSRRVTPVAYWGLRPGTVVILCSPLTDDAAAVAAADCAARGHQVLVIDTLPGEQILRAAGGNDRDHLRILTLQRELRLESLRRAGIPVLNWEAGSIELQLATMLKALRGRR